MFVLDKLIFAFIYAHCKALGATFCLGAFEGFVIYFSTITLGFTAIFGQGNKK